MQQLLISIILCRLILLLSDILEYFSPFLLWSHFLIHLGRLSILQLWQFLPRNNLEGFL